MVWLDQPCRSFVARIVSSDPPSHGRPHGYPRKMETSRCGELPSNPRANHRANHDTAAPLPSHRLHNHRHGLLAPDVHPPRSGWVSPPRRSSRPRPGPEMGFLPGMRRSPTRSRATVKRSSSGSPCRSSETSGGIRCRISDRRPGPGIPLTVRGWARSVGEFQGPHADRRGRDGVHKKHWQPRLR